MRAYGTADVTAVLVVGAVTRSSRWRSSFLKAAESLVALRLLSRNQGGNPPRLLRRRSQSSNASAHSCTVARDFSDAAFVVLLPVADLPAGSGSQRDDGDDDRDDDRKSHGLTPNGDDG